MFELDAPVSRLSAVGSIDLREFIIIAVLSDIIFERGIYIKPLKEFGTKIVIIFEITNLQLKKKEKAKKSAVEFVNLQEMINFAVAYRFGDAGPIAQLVRAPDS